MEIIKERKIMRTKLLLVLIILSTNLYPYFFMNQRNHPEIDWKQIKSKNIEVVYHNPLLEEAKEAMKISEATYASLVKTYSLELDKKIKIFITNQDKITNGYSAAGKYIAIWVNVNDYVNIFTGREKWMRKVLAHEISHHFVFCSVKSWIDIFFPVSSLSFPSDFNEGYAMFFSGEEWGYGREDANLRKGVYSNDLSYNYPDGFFYTTGFSMVRYLYEFYGLEKLQELLKYRNKLKLYSFKTAFKKVYGKSLKTFKDEWRRYVYTYYYGTAYDMKNQQADTSSTLALETVDKVKIKGWKKIRSFVTQDSLIFFLGKQSKKQAFYHLNTANFNEDTLVTGELKLENIAAIKKIPSAMDLAISSNRKYCAYVTYEREKYGSIKPKIYVYDIENDKLKRGETGRLVQLDNDGGYYYQFLNPQHNYIKYRKTEETKDVLKFNKKTAIGDIKLSPTTSQLAVTLFDEKGKFLINIYDTDTFELVRSNSMERFPREIFWENDNQLIVTIPDESDSRTAINIYNVADNQWEKFETPPYNVIVKGIEKTDSTHKALASAQLDRQNNALVKIPLKNKTTDSYTPGENYYTRWINTEYPNEITMPDTMPSFVKNDYSHVKNLQPYMNLIIPDTESLFFMTYWMDPLVKHSLSFAGYLEYDGWDPYYLVNYANRSFTPTISLNYMKFVWLAGIWDNTWYFQDMENASITVSMPLDISNNPFLSINLSTGMMYQDVAMREETFPNEQLFEGGIAYSWENGIRINYNLPYRNASVHPIKKYQFQYHLGMANSDLGMKKDFVEHEFDVELNYAPLYDLTGSDVFLFTNKTNFNFINGNYLPQYQPGLDNNDNIPIGDGLITERHYLRGIENISYAGKKLLVTKNELWMKITDDMKLSLNFGAPLIDIGYVGVGLWSDYGQFWYNEKKENFTTAGYEIKGVVNLLGIPTTWKYGRAYNLDNEQLNYYYQVRIPVNMGI